MNGNKVGKERRDHHDRRQFISLPILLERIEEQFASRQGERRRGLRRETDRIPRYATSSGSIPPRQGFGVALQFGNYPGSRSGDTAPASAFRSA